MPEPFDQPLLQLPLHNGRTAVYHRPLIMGILNLTPDSFSDGSRFNQPDTALDHARAMIADGADIIDVGPESTRPGATRTPPDQQIERITPLIKQLADHIQREDLPTLISIDTTRAPVAAAALDQGAHIINDVSAARDDPGILHLAADHRRPIVLMHMQHHPHNMQDEPRYGDVVPEVLAFLLERADVARQASIQKNRIIIDPGIGFGKTLDHNLQLLANLDKFVDTGYRVLLGASRKRFIADLAQRHGLPTPDTDHRLGATCAATAAAVAAGVPIIRVHDVLPNRQAADLTHALTKRPKSHIKDPSR